MTKQGIPSKILEELKLKAPKKKITARGRIISEKHQVTIKIPAKIRNELELKNSQTCLLTFDPSSKEILVVIKDA